MVNAEDFKRAFRSGQKASTRNLMVYVATGEESHAVRVGFVVSKAVGNAVTRNRVKRRLRAIVHNRLTVMHPGIYVIRAFPQAATATYHHLERDVDTGLSKLQ